MNYTILIPAYNETNSLKKIIYKLQEKKLPFLIVNDGSTDLTLPILQQNTKNFITYPNNEGKGYAIKKGAKYLINTLKIDYILIMDADGQCAIEDIPLFIKAQQRYPTAKIIIGNRLYNHKNMPFIRYWTNILMSKLISYLAGTKIIDSQCGFRLVHKDVFNLPLSSNRFELESEMLIKAGKAGINIVNVPIQCIYKEGRESKINPIKDMIRFFKMIWRLK